MPARWQAGGLRVDTPFGSIRGRAHAGGFGMLSLTALTFSLMKRSPGRRPERHIPGRRQHHIQRLRARRIRTRHQGGGPATHHCRGSRSNSRPAPARVLGQREPSHKFSCANGGVAGGPAGGARHRHERGWDQPGRARLRSSSSHRCNRSILFRLTALPRSKSRSHRYLDLSSQSPR